MLSHLHCMVGISLIDVINRVTDELADAATDIDPETMDELIVDTMNWLTENNYIFREGNDAVCSAKYA